MNSSSPLTQPYTVQKRKELPFHEYINLLESDVERLLGKKDRATTKIKELQQEVDKLRSFKTKEIENNKYYVEQCRRASTRANMAEPLLVQAERDLLAVRSDNKYMGGLLKKKENDLISMSMRVRYLKGVSNDMERKFQHSRIENEKLSKENAAMKKQLDLITASRNQHKAAMYAFVYGTSALQKAAPPLGEFVKLNDLHRAAGTKPSNIFGKKPEHLGDCEVTVDVDNKQVVIERDGHETFITVSPK